MRPLVFCSFLCPCNALPCLETTTILILRLVFKFLTQSPLKWEMFVFWVLAYRFGNISMEIICLVILASFIFVSDSMSTIILCISLRLVSNACLVRNPPLNFKRINSNVGNTLIYEFPFNYCWNFVHRPPSYLVINWFPCSCVTSAFNTSL